MGVAVGAESLTATLYNRRPSTTRGLFLALRADRRQEQKNAYLYAAVRQLVYSVGGKNTKFPSFWEYCNDLGNAHKQSADNRSAEDIKNDIIKRLGG